MKISKTIINKQTNTNKNIALIGHMGSGKTIIGKLLASKLNMSHIDSDKIIENKCEKSINQIFDQIGESEFREIEEKVILDIENKINITLSLGGGSILSKKVRNMLKKNFFTVFLDVDINILIERLVNSKRRPLLRNQDIGTKLKKLDLLRRNYYLLADIIINNCQNSTVTISEILNQYKKLDE